MTNIDFEQVAKLTPWNYRMPFGSYNGKTIATIHNTDPSYVVWIRDKCDGVAQYAAQNFLKAETRRILGKSDWTKEKVFL